MPVTFAVLGTHTPSDWNVWLCSEKVKYIDGESRRPSSKLESPAAPGAFEPERDKLVRIADREAA